MKFLTYHVLFTRSSSKHEKVTNLQYREKERCNEKIFFERELVRGQTYTIKRAKRSRNI